MTAEADQIVCVSLGCEPVEPEIPEAEIAKAREISRRYHAGGEPCMSGEEFKAWLDQKIVESRAEDQLH